MKKCYKKYLRYLIIIPICLVHLCPLYVLATVSFKPATDLSSRWLMPETLYWGNFERALTASDLLLAFKNSGINTICSIVLVILVGSFAAYPLARRKTRFNDLISRFSMGIMMVPPLTILVPLYSTMVSLGGISTYWGIVAVMVTFTLPMSIYLFTNFIAAIPKSLDEAAALDGCGYARTFFSIILPQLKPVITSVAILNGVGYWNDYSFSLYLLQAPKLKTVTMVISSYFSQATSELNVAAAAAMCAVLPLVAVFIILQKYFVQGMVDSALKE